MGGERGDPRSARGADWSLPVLLVLVALLVVGLAGTSAVQLRDSRRAQARAETAAANEAATATAAVRVNELAATVAELSVGVVSGGPEVVDQVRLPGALRVAYAPIDADRRVLAGLMVDGIDLVALRPALDAARDGVEVVVLSAPMGTPPVPVLIDPIYRRDDGTRSLTPSENSTAARRSELDGFVLAAIDVAEVVDPPDAATWTLSDGPAVLVGAGDTDGMDRDDVIETSIDVLGRQWELTSSVSTDGWESQGLWLAGLSLTAAALIALAGARTISSLGRQRRAAQRARQRAQAIATLSGVVQQSHELGEILPGLAIQLSDSLGLGGMSLAVATSGGRFREVFTHGSVPASGADRDGLEGDRLEAGSTASIHLHRAERSIAVLRVVAGRDLAGDDLDLLRLASEMITSAVVTSRSLEQQQDAVARLQVLDELKTAFLGTASHELRTPVTAISGFAFVLSERWDQLAEPDRKVFAERIASNARALDALVQDLLDFARLERGDHAIVLERLDLSDLVAQVLDRLEPVWQTHTISTDIEPGVSVSGDRAALERVVTNLVSNAVKFSPEGATVEVGVDARDGRARLVVDDAGPGVPPAERDKIFVRFFRGSSQAVVRTRGVGIGLSVVEDFVSRMEGSIGVGDSPAGGARFFVEFPLLDPLSEQPAGSTAPISEEGSDVPTP